MNELVVKWDTGKKEGTNNLLTTENFRKIGLTESDIKTIEPFFAVPGSLYTEDGIAGPNHPCCGSVGANIVTKDDKRASIQDIFYHDEGHSGGDYRNIPHWNRERRFIDTTGNKNRIPSQEDHILEDSESLTISFKDTSGIEHKQTIKKDY